MAQSEKQKEWKQKNYQDNKEFFREKQLKRRKDIRAFIESLKKPCVVCGEEDKACIDFHHVNEEEKDFTIGDATLHKWSNKKILAEVEKCVCLCSNHHRKLHHYSLTIDELIEKENNLK